MEINRQTDILQPIKLKTPNSLSNCLFVAGEKSLASFSQKGGVHNTPPIFTFSKQTELNDFDPPLSKLEKLADRIEQVYKDVFDLLKSIFGKKSQEKTIQEFEKNFIKTGKFSKQTELNDFDPPLSKLEKLADRIEQCPFGAWVHLHCNSCSGQLTNKPFKQVCLSNFCKEAECLKTRIRIRSMKLNDYYITSKNLYNFVIGFVAVEKITKEMRIKYHKTFMKILKQLQKIYGKFYFISVRDLNKTKDGKIRLHYHIATLPLKDFRKFTSVLSSICNKIEGVAPSFSGYKKKTSVISYFSKRASGDFGHNRNDEKKFGFSDFMKLEEYYNVFYGTKTFNSNLSFRVRKHSELILMLNNVPKICPHCCVLTKQNTHCEPVIGDPPPDNIQIYPQELIEVIKI